MKVTNSRPKEFKSSTDTDH